MMKKLLWLCCLLMTEAFAFASPRLVYWDGTNLLFSSGNTSITAYAFATNVSGLYLANSNGVGTNITLKGTNSIEGYLALTDMTNGTVAGVGDGAGVGSAGAGRSFFGTDAGQEASGLLWGAYGMRAGFHATGDYWHALGPWAGYYSRASNSLYLGYGAGAFNASNSQFFVDIALNGNVQAVIATNAMIWGDCTGSGGLHLGWQNGLVEIRGGVVSTSITAQIAAAVGIRYSASATVSVGAWTNVIINDYVPVETTQKMFDPYSLVDGNGRIWLCSTGWWDVDISARAGSIDSSKGIYTYVATSPFNRSATNLQNTMYVAGTYLGGNLSFLHSTPVYVSSTNTYAFMAIYTDDNLTTWARTNTFVRATLRDY